MRLTRLDPDIEAELRAAELTYDDVGSTSGRLPGGYAHLHREATLGFGAERFDDAARAMFAWQMHLRSGFAVATSSDPVDEQTVAILRLGVGPIRISAPCRVVRVTDEPNRKGFAYGTLDGHPESGEESFVIEHREDDTVSLIITAFSKPASTLARLGGPVSRVVQRTMTDRYLRSLAEPSGGPR